LIIVTGATGFIGSNIVADLNAAGRTDIILVDDLGTQDKWKNIAKRRFDDVVLPSEMDSLQARLSGAEAVYHMGANSSTTAADGDAILRSNFRASKLWWEWCSRTRTPFIYASSAATYGDGSRGFFDDQTPAALDDLRPLNLYGWSKHAFDKWAVARAATGEAPPQWCGLKFFNVYGPNENHKADMRSLVSKNTGAVADGGRIKLFKSYRPEYADGEQCKRLHGRHVVARGQARSQRTVQSWHRPSPFVCGSHPGHRQGTGRSGEHRVHRYAGVDPAELSVLHSGRDEQIAQCWLRPSLA